MTNTRILVASIVCMVVVEIGAYGEGAGKAEKGQAPEATAFRCELADIRTDVSVQHSIDYLGDKTEVRTSGWMNVSILVRGPSTAKLEPIGRMRGRDPDSVVNVTFEEILDTTGKSVPDTDLPRGGRTVNWEAATEMTFRTMYRNVPHDALGILTVRWMGLSHATNGLSALRGVVILPVVDREETLTLKPLAEHLNEPAALPDGSMVTFTEIGKERVEYTVRPKGTGLPEMEIEFRGPDGRKLESGGSGMSGRQGGYVCHQSFRTGQPPPAGLYATITMPTKRRLTNVPFEFRNIRLPRQPAPAPNAKTSVVEGAIW